MQFVEPKFLHGRGGFGRQHCRKWILVYVDSNSGIGLFLVIGRSGKTDIDSGCFALFGARSC